MPSLLRGAVILVVVMALVVAGGMLARSWSARRGGAEPVATRASLGAALLAAVGATLALSTLPGRGGQVVVIALLVAGVLGSALARRGRRG